ncbi:hypothetical protein HMI54_012338 [Coelomomyces lativittatus]|nr:hypothetical protein HMI54_012338 [Coelomomyces lativittatus]
MSVCPPNTTNPVCRNLELYTTESPYLELFLNVFYTALIASLVAAMLGVKYGKLNGTPTGRILFLLYVNDLIYCVCQQLLNGFALFVTLDNYDIPFVIFIKFVECYSKNACILFNMMAAVMYIDLSRSTSFLSVRKWVTNPKKFRVIALGIVFAGLISSIVSTTVHNSVLVRRNYLFIGNNDFIFLQLIIYSFGWSSIFSFITLCIKWVDFYSHKPKETLSGTSGVDTLMVLKFAGLLSSFQQSISVIAVMIPLFGIENSKDPWLTILNLSAFASLPLDVMLPFIAARNLEKSRSQTASHVAKLKNNLGKAEGIYALKDDKEN